MIFARYADDVDDCCSMIQKKVREVRAILDVVR